MEYKKKSHITSTRHKQYHSVGASTHVSAEKIRF